MSPDEVAAYLASIRNREMETPNVPLIFGLSTLDGYDGGVLPLATLGRPDLTHAAQRARRALAPIYAQLKTAPDPKLL